MTELFVLVLQDQKSMRRDLQPELSSLPENGEIRCFMLHEANDVPNERHSWSQHRRLIIVIFARSELVDLMNDYRHCRQKQPLSRRNHDLLVSLSRSDSLEVSNLRSEENLLNYVPDADLSETILKSRFASTNFGFFLTCKKIHHGFTCVQSPSNMAVRGPGPLLVCPITVVTWLQSLSTD